MTTPSLSWIDRTRWTALLDGTAAGAATRGDPRRAPAKAGGAASAPLHAPTPQPSPVVAASAPAEPVAAPPPSVKGPPALARAAAPVSTPTLPLPFEAPIGEMEERMEERLNAFFEWLIRAVPCTSAFIADDSGLPLVHRGAAPEHVAFSSSVLSLLESLEGVPRRWMSIGISAREVLHLAEVGTLWGRFAVGIVATESLRRDVLALVQQGLERAFEEQ